MIGTHHIITSDVYDIVDRMKEIDPSYYIVRNYKTKKFELHAKNVRGDSLCLVFQFNRVDARMLEHARKTRVERATKLIAEFERENQRLHKLQTEAVANKAIASVLG